MNDEPSSSTQRQTERVSACIVALNEADRIRPCLESLAWCDEILVVDSHSTDDTREIAASYGARIIERDWPVHVEQKEFAISAAKHNWVLCIDDDEALSPQLTAEILALRDAGFPAHAGWSMPLLSTFLGEPMRHGGWYPDRNLRLFDRRRGYWGGRNPHDHVAVEGSVGQLHHPMRHEPYRSFAAHLRTMDSYSRIGAVELARAGKHAGILDLLFRPSIRFFKFYFLKAGWRDGWRGFLLAYLSAYGCFLKYAKLMVMERIEDST